MAKLVALYKRPTDTAKFDAYYYGTHVPIAKKVPGLRAYEVSRGPVNGVSGPSPYHVVALLEFDSMESLGQGLASPEGQAAAGDLGNFATGGVDLLLFDTKEI
jgi:uncharacterized protein (TIGR02118 family)